MKKLILSLSVMLFVSVFAFAQTKFGVSAGTSFASMKTKIEGVSITTDSKVGFSVGFLADMGISENFAFQPGLNFNQKGGKMKSGNDEATQTLNYIEVPLNFIFKTQAGNGKFFGGLGPVLGYGISGKSKYKENGSTETEDINFGNDEAEDDVKPFEASGNILAGYEFANGFFAAVNYNLGLSNIALGDGDYSTKNRFFGIRIGYMFGGK